MLRMEEMTVFARFKYQKDRPALRVHIWEIFDFANLNTASFKDLFQSIYDQLCDVYDEQQFEEDVHEIDEIMSESDEVLAPLSDDSCNEKLLYDMGQITNFDFGEDDESLKSEQITN